MSVIKEQKKTILIHEKENHTHLFYLPILYIFRTYFLKKKRSYN